MFVCVCVFMLGVFLSSVCLGFGRNAVVVGIPDGSVEVPQPARSLIESANGHTRLTLTVQLYANSSVERNPRALEPQHGQVSNAGQVGLGIELRCGVFFPRGGCSEYRKGCGPHTTTPLLYHSLGEGGWGSLDVVGTLLDIVRNVCIYQSSGSQTDDLLAILSFQSGFKEI